jgi:P22_AR N-terminal domain.
MSDLIPIEQKLVNFNGAELMAIKCNDGNIRVGVRWVCNGLTFDENQYRVQMRKIQDDITLQKGVTKMSLPTPGGNQEVLCLELSFLPLWLAKINANIIDDPEVQDRLVDYQLHAKDVLVEAFLQQPMPKKSRTISRVKPAIKDAFDTAEYLTQKLGIKMGIAQAACIRAVERNCGLDLTEIAKCLPSAEHETGFLNATEIGKRIGTNAVKANKMLAAKGLQEQKVDAKGNKKWRITEAGKQYGEEFPFLNHGHSDYQIKWNESVIGVLMEPEEKDQVSAVKETS